MYIKLLTEQKELRKELADFMFAFALTKSDSDFAEIKRIKQELSDLTWAIKEFESNMALCGGVVN